MKKRTSSFGLGVGATSILMIFVLLCLVVFAVLSLVSANADWKLSSRLAGRIEAYYNACLQGEELLEQIDSQLASLYEEAEDADGYLLSCRSYLSSLDGELTEEEQTGDLLFSFREEITEEQHLAVTLLISVRQAAGEPFYQIKTWQTEASQVWEPDNSLNLIE